MSQDLPIKHLDDARVRDIDLGFRKLISGIALAFEQVAKQKGMRATHSFGTTAQGVLEVLAQPDIPSHKLFVPGRKFPIVLRHANAKGFKDDAISDGCGATLRLLDGAADAPLTALNLNKPLLDVLLGTGRSFPFANALSFARWVRSTLSERAEMLEELPRAKSSLEEFIRNPESYTKLHYYSQTTYLFIGVDGKQYYLRYRLINANKSPDTGLINPKDLQLPLDYVPRAGNDQRPETYLQTDFCQQVKKGGLQYLLQVQLRGIEQSLECNELAKDCTIPWDEVVYPLRDLAVISFKSIIPDEIAELLQFNAYNAPTDLAMILAKSSQETASINHIRSVVYEISADIRNKQQHNPELIMTENTNPPNPKDIFVYHGTAGKDIARFDFNSPLPANLQPTPRYNALATMVKLNPPSATPPTPPLVGIYGTLGIMGANVTKWMPANLSRCHPHKFSDEYFVERRLNGFNPGKLNRVQGQAWQYVVRYNCAGYEKDAAGIFPDIIEARFILKETELQVHSIQFSLDGTISTHVPGDEKWEWSKRLFRSVEFVFHEIQSHLGRTHMNMDQYAMAFYRNIVNNPIKQLIEPHFEGLLNIDKLGSALIIGETGFIPEASVLKPTGVDEILTEYVSQLSYHWKPSIQALPDRIDNNHFDKAALAMWNLLEEYVRNFFQKNKAAIQANWSEIEGMSKDLIDHSILKPELGTLAIKSIDDLKQLCVYIIYHCTFFHSWVNNKQYDDGGDIEYTAIGLWDDKNPAYNPVSVATKNATQTILMWTLSHVLYNPVMEVGPAELKELIWKNRKKIQPGIPLELIMMSINI